jgi:hypothetical protein
MLFHSQSSAFAQNFENCHLDYKQAEQSKTEMIWPYLKYDAHFEIIKFNPLLNGLCRK